MVERVAAHRKASDRQRFSRAFADGDVGELHVPESHRPGRVGGFAELAVGHHDDLRRGEPGQRIDREAQTAGEVGRGVAGLGAGDGALQIRDLAGQRRQRCDRGVHLRDEHAIAAGEPARAIVRTRSLAVSRRVGATSVAFILALASMSTTTLRPSMRFAAVRGSPSARSISARSASWRRSERMRFNCEKRLVASLSRRMRSQIFENGTETGRRRSFKM